MHQKNKTHKRKTYKRKNKRSKRITKVGDLLLRKRELNLRIKE